ncbi:lysine N(6)-hydroxylase/L-ornithine N(5)-oxygenase family protein [Paracraurococcus lichenis]|uniref:SidA/IucD/PvdA family monooxygenase n=1 Tax=Paracraurococcus lichenis TaxID=3064888 RepID=A0ABT9E8R3_9PROT|nr:SidA/IucD/PvdA family monooxygenase [Paracraurococcus sp. LOR1-02]MDO9712512.1 SidA/IucD/PvdA family monooxygenase [Paracraurococcus sp. LOR1-02]
MRATLEIAGIGIGPANLSLAALCEEAGESSRARFFDRKPAFAWHRGMMLPGARLQCSWIKDLITPIAPTSRFGFLSYLADRGRLFAFVNAGFEAVSRAEFADYLAWVAERLPGLQWNSELRDIGFEDGAFTVHAGRESVRARHLVLGLGHEPSLPACLEPYRGTHCVHAAEFLERTLPLARKRVAVVGGGQSGAEIVLHLLRMANPPARLTWISRRSNFLPLDETHFSNEHFTPAYVEHFFSLSVERRSELLREQRMMSDGISPSTLRELYAEVYRLQFLERGAPGPRLLPGRSLVACAMVNDAFRLEIRAEDTAIREALAADVVIAATGYRTALPSCLEKLRIVRDPATAALQLGRCYAAAWDGPPGNRIYLQNAGRWSHGIADPQLALLAWRSATILNDALGREVFALGGTASVISWSRNAEHSVLADSCE